MRQSADELVHVQAHEAAALLSSARWMQYCIRQGQIGGTPDEQTNALAELQEAIDELSTQLRTRTQRERPAPWRGYVVAVLAVCATTVLIQVCCLLGLPHNTAGLYIPVVIGVSLIVGRWPALLGCGLAFVLNDVLFVHPLRFSPTPDQVAALAVVALGCLVLHWLVRAPLPSMRRFGLV
jgi:K+-sensing histidine kinase KdpD